MISILCEDDLAKAAAEIAEAIQSAYHLGTPPQHLAPDAVWNGQPEWDDLLIVLYASDVLPQSAQAYIEAFRRAHAVTVPGAGAAQPAGAVMPVAASAKFPVPPAPIAGIKAAKYDGTPEARDAIARAAGTFLGLALRPGNHPIFISYRAIDGKVIAEDLYERLRHAGFPVWLDTAEENLVVGDDVQEKIRDHVQGAAMVVLVDTPEAPQSQWIAVEVDAAIGHLIPIIPVVAGGERVSRFVDLAALRRCAVVKRDGIDGVALSEAEWQDVEGEIKEVLLTTYRRRLRLTQHAERVFSDAGFKWAVLDPRRRMYKADRHRRPNPATVVVSHCSVHDVTDVPALRSCIDYVNDAAARANDINYKLCIYDRPNPLSDPEFTAIEKSLNNRLPLILAHYNELGLLIESNFARLR